MMMTIWYLYIKVNEKLFQQNMYIFKEKESDKVWMT